MPGDLTAAMAQTIDPMRLIRRVTDRTLELIGSANGVMVGLSDGHGVTYVCGAGNQGSYVGTRVKLDSSLSGLSIRTHEIQYSGDTSVDDRVDADACRRLSVVSLVCVPLTQGHEALGVIAVNATEPHAFSSDDIATLTRLAEFMSLVVWSACGLSDIAGEILRADPGRERSSTGSEQDPLAAAARFVMEVLSPGAVDRVESSERIQRFLDDPGTVSMVFQPIVDIASGDVVAVEALARFATTPYRTPDVWFDQAHRGGLGVELEILAVRRAIAALPLLGDDLAVTINAGPRAIASAEFRAAIDGAPPSRIIVELTEHTEVEDYPELMASLRLMRQAGTRIAIDDTGSGYSSLTHILRLAPDFIKLDRDLVSGIDVDPVRRALASSLVMFAGETGAHIIAEGVETEDELEVLRSLGVHFAQGYHLGRPAPLPQPAGDDRAVAHGSAAGRVHL